MISVFKGTLLALARERSVFIWVLAFPLVLSTMFAFMFAHLDDAAQLKPVRVAVVADARYEDAPGFAEVIDALSEPGDGQLLDVARVESEDAAIELMRATDAGSSAPGGGSNEGVVGYVAVGADGVPGVHVRGGPAPGPRGRADQALL